MNKKHSKKKNIVKKNHKIRDDVKGKDKKKKVKRKWWKKILSFLKLKIKLYPLVFYIHKFVL